MIGRKDKKHIDIKVPSAEGAATAPPAETNGDQPQAPAAATTEAPLSEADSLRQQLEQEKDRNLRLRAEQQNMQRRAAQERTDAIRFANADLIRGLLNPIDDFDRTLAHGAEGGTEAVLKGVRLIYDNLVKVLKDQHVEIIDPMNAVFDPRFHEAMMQLPAEGKTPGTVIQVLQRGYKMHDRVLRPAKVVLAAQPAAPTIEAAKDTTAKPTIETKDQKE